MYKDLSCWNKWILKNKPLFGGIVETRVKQPKISKFVNTILPGWFFTDNYNFSALGKVWVLWHPSVKVVVLSKSLQQVTCEVCLPAQNEAIIVTIVYAANDRKLRAGLWVELETLATSSLLVNKPWSVLGDFNQTLSPQEHSSPNSLNIDKQMREFGQSLLHAELGDLNFRGNTFTWCNKQKSKPVAKKLDRVLVPHRLGLLSMQLWLKLALHLVGYFLLQDQTRLLTCMFT
ncbi:hypothetical protein Bca52824_076933 [Brassica carinata]|uniref:Endonuclease/exonuclease/phosphatase domain-containing protein n=1 Tax=Brassica carinata TaxID=52824 RepID=A0A8X7TXS6_BRACI|nr:hypothetical protein Bca52824_076933 [Brassica carinata]